MTAPRRPPTRLVLLGHPVSQSLSPVFQNAALAHAGLAARYETMDVPPERVRETLESLAAEGAAGNVTIPHKEQARATCSRVTPLADRVGAVNTFWPDDDGALCGDNTDVGGFDELVLTALDAPPSGVRVALLGAGGSAAAVLAAVERWPGCEVAVWGRGGERGRALAERFGRIASAAATPDAALTGARIVVNATPVGLAADSAMPVDAAQLPPDAVVVDLVYRRDGAPTEFVRRARERGLRAVDGLPMLIAQGALAFERWFGFAPDREVMWRSVR